MTRWWIWSLAALVASCAQPTSGPRPVSPPVPAAELSPPPDAQPSAASPKPHQPSGLLIPLYSKPTTTGWTRVAALKQRHPTLPVIAIVNANDGASWGVDDTYTKGIAALHTAGVIVLGYVFTGYGDRAPTSVKREVTRWHDEYPLVDGIFFDEMSTDAATLGFYQQAAADVRHLEFKTLIGNFGTQPAPGLADTVDVAVTYENAGLPEPNRQTGVASDHQAFLAYGVHSFDEKALLGVIDRYRYLYVTDDGDPDPWNSVSTQLESLGDMLDVLAR